MHIEKPEYESPKFQMVGGEIEDIIRTSPDFDGGQSGLSF